jgi:glycosyltransferase involved in cell wall biosynthesis
MTTSPLRVRMQCTRYGHWGGHSGYALLARRLDPACIVSALHVASDSDDDLPISYEPLRAWLRRKVQSRGMQWYKLSDLAAEIKAITAAMAGRADVIHCLDGEHTAQYLPLWRDGLRMTRPKMVVTYHQPPDLLASLIDPAIVKLFDRVITVSPSQNEFFTAFLPPEKVVTILHGIDTDFFSPAPDPAAGISEQRTFRCVAAGQWLRDWVTLGEVAKRFQQDRDIEFHVVSGRPTGLEDLSNVTHHRNIDDEALRDLYRDCDVLCMPLTGATANNAILEALACGLPIITTDLASTRAYVEDAGILAASGDADGIAAAVRALRSDASRKRELAARARARAECLAWPRIAKIYERFYAELVEMPSSAAAMVSSSLNAK